MRGQVRDIMGQRFGHWTVIEFLGVNNHRAEWLCRCDCGTERVMPSGRLCNGSSKSCGCAREHHSGGKRMEDITGRRFGHWTVIELVGKYGRQSYWLCRCDCGKESVKSRSALGRYDEESSCGCTRRNPKKAVRIQKGARYECCGVG